jgi:oligopeptide/dipeptide ABC transporter ATP-binding protein
MHVGRIGRSRRPKPVRVAEASYTEALLSAVPKPIRASAQIRIILQGEAADPANTPPGCHFHPRRSYAGCLPRKSLIQEEIASNHS